MKKNFFSFLLVLAILLGFPGESADAKSWQNDAVFSDGAYEGYYAQCNDMEKLIYNKIKKAFATPVKKATISFEKPIHLTAKKSGSFTSNDLFQWGSSAIGGVRRMVSKDHPEMPWLLGVFSYGYVGEWEKNAKGVSIGLYLKEIIITNVYPWIQDKAYKSLSSFQKGIKNAMAAIGKARPSRAATVRAISEYLCKLITYEKRQKTVRNKNGTNYTVYYDQSAYSVLSAPHRGVCSSYSAAFKLLCDRYGIPSVHVSGDTSRGLHAWNYVLLEDNRWYIADPTWMDNRTIDYRYFLTGGDSFKKDHRLPAKNDGNVSPAFSKAAYPYLEAALGKVQKTIAKGKSMQISLNKIADLKGAAINNETAGLFVDNAKKASASGTIKNGRVSLRYKAKAKAGKHMLYIKCTSGKQKGAILAAVEVRVK